MTGPNTLTMPRKDQARAETISATMSVDNPNQQAQDSVQGDVPRQNMDWQPPKALETPPAPAGWHFTWVRSMMGAEDDSKNVLAARREGYEFATSGDIPAGYFLPTIEDARFGSKTLIAVRDMVLMKIPLRMKKQRDAHYAQRGEQQMDRIDQKLTAAKMREGDRLIVMERNSTTELRKPRQDDEE